MREGKSGSIKVCRIMPKFITTLCCLAAIALGFAPPHMQSWLRSVVRDGLRSGVQLAAATRQSVATQMTQRLLGDENLSLSEQISNLESELVQTQQQLRQERLAHQATRQKNLLALRRHDAAHQPIDPPPLIVPQVVQASVLGDELASAWRAVNGKLLDRGQLDGLSEAALVLNANTALLDQGEDVGLAPDMPVFAGSCVIGKLQYVGRWSSTWVPLTDKRFRGRARLARVMTDGLVFGAEGILGGNGQEGCLLTKIRATEPVVVGDEVYSLESPGGFAAPLFYGTVTRAELASGATHWEIEVRPATNPRTVRAVCVLRPHVNPKRLAN